MMINVNFGNKKLRKLLVPESDDFFFLKVMCGTKSLASGLYEESCMIEFCYGLK